MVQGLLKEYASIPPCLITIEDLLYGTATGQREEMTPFYVFWEHALYHAINDMVRKGVHTLVHAIARRHAHKEGETHGKKPPLFKVGSLVRE